MTTSTPPTHAEMYASVDHILTDFGRMSPQHRLPALMSYLYGVGVGTYAGPFAGLSDAQVGAVLLEVWSMLDAPFLQIDDTPEDALEILTMTFSSISAGVQRGDGWGCGHGFILSHPYGQLPPSEPLTLYRGAHPDFRLGVSWTTSLDRARFFAEGSRWMVTRAALNNALRSDPGDHATPSNIYRAVAPPDAVLALSAAREESEVIVDPQYLEEWHQLDESTGRWESFSPWWTPDLDTDTDRSTDR